MPVTNLCFQRFHWLRIFKSKTIKRVIVHTIHKWKQEVLLSRLLRSTWFCIFFNHTYNSDYKGRLNELFRYLNQIRPFFISTYTSPESNKPKGINFFEYLQIGESVCSCLILLAPKFYIRFTSVWIHVYEECTKQCKIECCKW